MEGERVRADLEAAVRDRTEQARLQQRLAGSEALLSELEQKLSGLTAALDRETRDVERLESFSPTRIWATLRGTRPGDLERETAERDAARYAAAEAEARVEAARRDRDGLVAQLAALGDVDAAYAAALAAKDAWVQAGGTPAAAELADLAERRGRLLDQHRETAEAHAAGLAARDVLTHAQQLLNNAGGWATWDALGGGGLLTDMAKYDKIDHATEVLRQADQALGTFSRELADVGLEGVPTVRIDSMTRAFDIFFDNIFSDLAVRARIREAEQRVTRILDVLTGLVAELEDRGRRLQGELAALDGARERLLTG